MTYECKYREEKVNNLLIRIISHMYNVNTQYNYIQHTNKSWKFTEFCSFLVYTVLIAVWNNVHHACLLFWFPLLVRMLGSTPQLLCAPLLSFIVPSATGIG